MQEGGEEERVREGCCLFVVICMYAQNVEQAPSIAVIEISLHLVHPWAMGGHVPPPLLHSSPATNFIVSCHGQRAADPLLSFGPPVEGGPPPPMEQSLSKRPLPPTDAEQVRATPVAQHGPWPRPHHHHTG